MNVQTPNSKFPKQAYIQTIDVRNDKYKKYPNMHANYSKPYFNHNSAIIKSKE